MNTLKALREGGHTYTSMVAMVHSKLVHSDCVCESESESDEKVCHVGLRPSVTKCSWCIEFAFYMMYNQSSSTPTLSLSSKELELELALVARNETMKQNKHL